MKQYNNERGIISLTSWKARINTVGLTLFSLYKQCPGFHIVLVLSEEEFPNKEKELPDTVMAFVNQDLIEILWVYKNYKSLKKVLFTMDKYPHIPVISADDDCLYICNYAEELYNLYLKNPNKICTINAPINHTNGTSTLYYPHCFGNPHKVISDLSTNKHLDVYMSADDGYYEILRKLHNSQIVYAPPHKIWEMHNDLQPLGAVYGNIEFMRNLRKIQSIDCNSDIGLSEYE